MRSTILQLTAGSNRVLYGDGRVLWIDGEEYPSVDDLHRLNEVRERLEGLMLPRAALPHFDLRIAAVESVMWAFTAYAFGSMVELFASGIFDTNGQLHVMPAAVVATGLVLAIILASLFLIVVYGLLRRSPQGRRLVLPLRTFLALWACLVGSVQLVSDLNRHLDASSPVMISRRILRREVHPGRYGRHYWLLLSGEDAVTGVMQDSDLEVSEIDYRRSFAGPDVVLHLKRGWLGLPWFEGIEFPPTTPKK